MQLTWHACAALAVMVGRHVRAAEAPAVIAALVAALGAHASNAERAADVVAPACAMLCDLAACEDHANALVLAGGVPALLTAHLSTF